MKKFLAIFNYTGLPSHAMPIIAKDLNAAIAIAAEKVKLIPCESIDVIPACRMVRGLCGPMCPYDPWSIRHTKGTTMNPYPTYDYDDYGPTASQRREDAFTKAVKEMFDHGNKILMIKAVRALTGMGLRESKNLVDTLWAGMVAEQARTTAQAWWDGLTDQAKIQTMNDATRIY